MTANAPPDAIAPLLVFADVTLRRDERCWSQRQRLIAIG